MSRKGKYFLATLLIAAVFSLAVFAFMEKKGLSPPICVKSCSQSREHRLPEMERLCARFFLHKFLDFIEKSGESCGGKRV